MKFFIKFIVTYMTVETSRKLNVFNITTLVRRGKRLDFISTRESKYMINKWFVHLISKNIKEIEEKKLLCICVHSYTHTHTLAWFPYICILGSLKLLRHFSVFLKAFYLYKEQRSVNDKSPFFEDLLLLFNFIHNSSFIQTFSLQNRGAFLRSRSPDVLVEHCIRQLYDTFLKLEACSSLYRSTTAK